eukprot:TRINITY_DN5295_c0_g1_i1.p1 TRINITY_DN5295_c0_g1~~TRINITY_DN5295_c0_g1_i1.p1  ORF type:complete len:257 (+),score=55.01 TRINITY_DN5295_c0_g1_i1:47-817(+)
MDFSSISRTTLVVSFVVVVLVGNIGYSLGSSREQAGTSVVVKNKLKVVESYTKSIKDCENSMKAESVKGADVEEQIEDALKRLEMFNELFDSAKNAYDECASERIEVAKRREKNNEYVESINQARQDISDIQTVIGEMRDEKEANRTTMKEKITSLRLENQKLRAVINESNAIHETENKAEKAILELTRQQGPGLGEVSGDKGTHKDGRDSRLRDLIAKGTLNQKDGWESDDQEWDYVYGEEKIQDQPPRRRRRRR